MSLFTLVLVIVAILQWCTTDKQLSVMRTQIDQVQQQIDAAKSANELTAESMRGRIQFTNARILESITVGKPITVILDWKNIGKSPAYSRTAHDVKRWRGMPEGGMPIAVSSIGSAGMIAPDDGGQISMTDFKPVAASFLDGLPKGPVFDISKLGQYETVYYFARIEYETIGRKHFSEWCAFLIDFDLANRQLSPGVALPIVQNRYMLNQCPKWHDAN